MEKPRWLRKAHPDKDWKYPAIFPATGGTIIVNNFGIGEGSAVNTVERMAEAKAWVDWYMAQKNPDPLQSEIKRRIKEMEARLGRAISGEELDGILNDVEAQSRKNTLRG